MPSASPARLVLLPLSAFGVEPEQENWTLNLGHFPSSRPTRCPGPCTSLGFPGGHFDQSSTRPTRPVQARSDPSQALH
ncbi:hypothetical protein F5883DRAFT_551484 [Diaporthe sp. PMI_573]|nr:hypothetical protein F5883DRAFT_551484 [Diaporthaceae sp. PMI_573]